MAAFVLCGLLAACVDAPPPPPSPWLRSWPAYPDADRYPVPKRPPCGDRLVAAVRISGDAIRAGRFTSDDVNCDDDWASLLVITIVVHSDADRVAALLEAGADPNGRSGGAGDIFPLEAALERLVGWRHRPEAAGPIVATLLRHRADPNQRWCPFESRNSYGRIRGCTAATGVTPLAYAAVLDRADLVYRLLDAGADPWLDDGADGGAALEYARSEAVLSLLESAMFPDVETRFADVVAYLEGRRSTLPETPTDTTSLTRALTDNLPRRLERITALLRRGADPNRRLREGGDLTPLALATQWRGGDAVALLLEHGADPNARWCSGYAKEWRPVTLPTFEGCTADRGLTALMAAASRGNGAAIRALLAHGAEPSLTDWKGRTARDHAREAKRLAEYDEAVKGARPRTASGRP